MDNDTIINLLVTFFIIVGIVYVYNTYIKIDGKHGHGKEGFEVAGGSFNSEKYAKILEETNIKIKDTLLVKDYKTQYKNIIFDLDTYLTNLMIEQALKIDVAQPELTDFNYKIFNNINVLKVTKDNLDNILKRVESN